MLVSLYYLTLWYPLPKLQPKEKAKEPQHDIHDSERGVQIQAPTVDRKQWPPQTGQLNEMRHRDRASNLQTVKVSCGSLGASSAGSQNGTYPVLVSVHASKTGEHRVGALRAGDPGSLRS